jgi:hypothetical protein
MIRSLAKKREISNFQVAHNAQKQGISRNVQSGASVSVLGRRLIIELPSSITSIKNYVKSVKHTHTHRFAS